jgi:hypothetical protein
MPKVPSYDNFQATPGILQGGQIDAPRVTGGLDPEMASIGSRQMEQLGQNMQRAASGLERIVMAEVEQANQVRVNDAMNKAVAARLKLTYDQAEGYTNLRGEAALNRPDGKPLDAEYGDKLRKEVDAIAQGLGNESQRRLFMAQAGRLSAEFTGGVTKHVAKEYGDYQMSVQDGTIATARGQMALEWGNPESLKQAQDATKAAVYQKGKLAGWSAKQTEAAMIEALSPGHSAVIASAADAGKLDYAREYMKQVNAELTPSARLQLAKTLETGDFEAKAQERTEQYMGQAGGDVAEALKLARANLSGKEEDAVVSRIKAIDAERVALRERGQSDAAEEAWKLYNAGQRIPASLQTRMDPRDWNTLRDKMRADAEGRAIKTDVTKWLEFTDKPIEQLARMTPQELLRDYRMHFSDGDLRNAQQMIMAARGQMSKGGSKAPGEVEGLQIITTTDLVKRGARELGVLPKSGPTTPAQEAAFLDFTDQIQIRVNEWEAANGKKATAEVVRKILNDEKLNKVRLDTWGTDPELPVIAVTPDKMGAAYVVVSDGKKSSEVRLASIPAAYRADAIRRRQAANLPVTEADIARMWVVDGRPVK